MSDEEKRENSVKNASGIPGMDDKTRLSADSYTTRESFKAFHQSGKYIGAYEGYGATISEKDRYFYSTREPVGVWWVKGIAYDIWDNWFRVKNVADKDDEKLDNDIQLILRQLKAQTQLPRETIFERRTGTSILLLSYTGFGSETSWETPLFTLNPDGTLPDTLQTNTQLLQITPYPWTSVTVDTIDQNPSSIRYGLPEYYKITQGAVSNDSPTTGYQQADDVITVHWSRVIHDAPRLDEHTYEGIPAIDQIFDDLIGGRNARWGAYETYYRHGTGFPVIKTKSTPEQNRAWIEAGGLDDYLNVRGYFICNTEEDFKFVGAEGAVLNPNTYFDMYFTFIAAATGVAKDTIQGVSAGRVTGSEVNERQYYKSISLHQNQKEPMLRELIDRIIQTGQVKFTGEYKIEWIDPFEVNPQDKAAIEFMIGRNLAQKTWWTVNEKRVAEGMEPIEGGDVLALQPGQSSPFNSPSEGQNAPNQEEPVPTETEPEESNQNASTLLDRLTSE